MDHEKGMFMHKAEIRSQRASPSFDLDEKVPIG